MRNVQITEEVSATGGGVFMSGGWFMPDQVPALVEALLEARDIALKQQG